MGSCQIEPKRFNTIHDIYGNEHFDICVPVRACVCVDAKLYGCAKAIISATDSKARAISYRNTSQSLNKLPCHLSKVGGEEQ